jgi:hypothetical protein
MASLVSRLEEARSAAEARAVGAFWSAVHVLGAHRWQEGCETDLVRGWRRYRGSRCSICDAPWEGW